MRRSIRCIVPGLLFVIASSARAAPRAAPQLIDPRDPDMYPPGTPHSFPAARGAGGPVSISYQFVVRGDHRFTFVWHNTTRGDDEHHED